MSSTCQVVLLHEGCELNMFWIFNDIYNQPAEVNAHWICRIQSKYKSLTLYSPLASSIGNPTHLWDPIENVITLWSCVIPAIMIKPYTLSSGLSQHLDHQRTPWDFLYDPWGLSLMPSQKPFEYMRLTTIVNMKLPIRTFPEDRSLNNTMGYRFSVMQLHSTTTITTKWSNPKT